MDANKEAEEILQKLPPAPAGVERWIRKTVIQHAYLIFDNKEERAVCTRCGRTFTLRRTHGAEHNKISTCPYCKTEAVWKKSCYGRKTLTEQFRVLIFAHKGKTVYGTLFEVDADFEEFGKARISRWISALYRFTETEQVYVKHHPGYGCGDFWEKRKEVKLPHPPTGYNWGTWCKYERTEVYTGNLEAVFTKSCLKYHNDQAFFKRYQFNAYNYIRYMDQCLKYQSMELLRKAGFDRLVLDRICEYSTKSLHLRGTTLIKILRLPKRWHKKVLDERMNAAELAVFQKLTEQEKGMCEGRILRLLMDDGTYKADIELYVPFFKAVQYIAEQDAVKQGRYLWEYRDYLSQAQLLGWDMTRKKILYPQNLSEAHDQVTRLVKEQEEELKIQGVERQAACIEQDFPVFQEGELFIRSARTQAELNQESQALNHCVRSYGKRIAEGRSKIFFIRRITEPDKPFYTLELNAQNKLVQCRGDHNCAMTEEVAFFVENWLKHCKKVSKKQTKEAA